MNFSTWLATVAAVGMLGACAAEPSRPARGHDKPGAPVTLKVQSVTKGSGRFEVHVVATMTEDVRSAQLRLILPEGVKSEEDDKPVSFGPTGKGKSLTLTRHLQLSVDGADVIADVRVDDGMTTRNRPQIIHVGKARPAEAPVHHDTVTLPNGDKVEEVRQ